MLATAEENTLWRILEPGVSSPFLSSPCHCVGRERTNKETAWVSGWEFSGQIKKEEMDAFPHLLKWVDRIAEVSFLFCRDGSGG